MTLTRMFDETYADVIAVLHESKLIYERYAGALSGTSRISRSR
ncbi:hypothetical protein [Tardiphaga sp. 619_E2_N8_5]